MVAAWESVQPARPVASVVAVQSGWAPTEKADVDHGVCSAIGGALPWRQMGDDAARVADAGAGDADFLPSSAHAGLVG